MKIFTKLSKLFFLFAVIIYFSSCKKHDPDVIVKGEARVKMINAAQTETDQDVYIDGEKRSISALAFSETTDYLKISSGSRSVKFIGSTNLETEATLNFTPSITYSTFLVNDRNGVREIVSYEDNLSNTESGKAKIKLINLTPYFSTGINVSVQAGTQFVNGLLYKEASAYFSVDAGMNLRYNVVGSGSIKTIDGVNLEAGKIYTIWFSGNSSVALEAHVITDN
ncbi:DUF4397 domain-containing protein [Pedobacter chinensis]|uniref:DUF4397 domain-containing protein n=1 Tax=Pedobacter chinensis TaxID=2282421 RepID=A0A369PSI8_9SPHI|nr:DUF4397 domain-containing protein [Pedobacter chinensis]RDC55503.1 DUF4397 domain-containing protein [Pedobacter chinensis]